MRLENHVSEYKETHHTCQSCKGTGSEKVTLEEVHEIMENTTPHHAVQVYKQWRNYGEIDCACCKGMGSFTERK